MAKWYGYDCAMCHGNERQRQGRVGADMKLKISDFTDPATLKERTDGELFSSSSSEKATCRRKALASKQMNSGTW